MVIQNQVQPALTLFFAQKIDSFFQDFGRINQIQPQGINKKKHKIAVVVINSERKEKAAKKKLRLEKKHKNATVY